MVDTKRFWDEHTGERGDADPALYGTVTDREAVVRLRDRLERAHIARAVHVGPTTRVLDLGGGAGRIALWLARSVAHVTLVDASPALLEVARTRAAKEGIENVSFVERAALSFLREDDAVYDLIVIAGLATHLEDDALAPLSASVADRLAPGGRLVLKEPVTTDGVPRADRRRGYVAHFRPRERYVELFGAHLRPLYQRATVAHPIPFFLGGTEEAADGMTGGRAALLERVAPVWERLDPLVLAIEEQVRAGRLSWLLAPVSVLQDLYVFGAPHAASDAPALSVVVIAYCEEECLEDVVTELSGALDEAEVNHELVLVDDGSTDGTLAAMHRLRAADPRIRVEALPKNRGIGGALRAGFDAAQGAYVTWVPADGQISPASVLLLFRRRDEAPMLTTVYTARDDAFYRHVISQTLNTLIRVRSGEVAKSGGNYLFSREAWRKHAPRDDDTMMISTGFRKNLRAAGVPIVEVGIAARKRVAGQSKVLNPKTILRTLSATLFSK
ncbi:MAG: glycosyltransferase [Sandaracinaceae bacterium]